MNLDNILKEAIETTPTGLSPIQLSLRAAILALPKVKTVEIEENVFEILPGQGNVILKW